MGGVDVSRGKQDGIPVVENQMMKMALYRVIIMLTKINRSGPNVMLSIRFIKFCDLNHQVGIWKQLCEQIAFSL